MSAPHDVTARLAATTILVRARGDQPELLLLKRGEHARFMPNAYVFAGGALDLSDESADVYALCNGLDDELASERLELPSNGLRFFVAAVREAFEECGLLLAYDARGDIAGRCALIAFLAEDFRGMDENLGQTSVVAGYGNAGGGNGNGARAHRIRSSCGGWTPHSWRRLIRTFVRITISIVRFESDHKSDGR